MDEGGGRSRPLFLNLGKVNATRVRSKRTQLVARTISTTRNGRVSLQRVVYPAQSPTVSTEGLEPSHDSANTPGRVEEDRPTDDFDSFEETGAVGQSWFWGQCARFNFVMISAGWLACYINASCMFAFCMTEAGTSAHHRRQQTLAEKWADLRDGLFQIGMSHSTMPSEIHCYVCKAAAMIRCHDCAPDTYFCQSCGMDIHRDINLFHMPEKWTVSCNLN